MHREKWQTKSVIFINEANLINTCIYDRIIAHGMRRRQAWQLCCVVMLSTRLSLVFYRPYDSFLCSCVTDMKLVYVKTAITTSYVGLDNTVNILMTDLVGKHTACLLHANKWESKLHYTLDVYYPTTCLCNYQFIISFFCFC